MNQTRNIPRFRRLATGAAMIATAPVVLASVAIKPADDGSAGEALANVASHASAMEASLVLGLIAIGLLIPATLGLMRGWRAHPDPHALRSSLMPATWRTLACPHCLATGVRNVLSLDIGGVSWTLFGLSVLGAHDEESDEADEHQDRLD